MSARRASQAERALAEFFAFERCAECCASLQHHTPIPDPFGDTFFRCDFPPAEDDSPHPVIRQFLAESGT